MVISYAVHVKHNPFLGDAEVAAPAPAPVRPPPARLRRRSTVEVVAESAVVAVATESRRQVMNLNLLEVRAVAAALSVVCVLRLQWRVCPFWIGCVIVCALRRWSNIRQRET